MNKTSWNQQEVVLELEILAPRGKDWQHGVGDAQAATQYALNDDHQSAENHELWLSLSNLCTDIDSEVTMLLQ